MCGASSASSVGDRVAEDGDAVVADQEGELAGRGRRVELRLGGEHPLDAGQRDPGSSLQLDRQRGEPVLVADPGEQFVAEVPAQPGQRGRQRRLAEAHLRRGPGDAALLQQGVQGHQQVEIQAGEVHGTTLSTR